MNESMMLTKLMIQEKEVVKGYDEKYNMEEEDSFENKDKEQEEERQKMESERSKSIHFCHPLALLPNDQWLWQKDVNMTKKRKKEKTLEF